MKSTRGTPLSTALSKSMRTALQHFSLPATLRRAGNVTIRASTQSSEPKSFGSQSSSVST